MSERGQTLATVVGEAGQCTICEPENPTDHCGDHMLGAETGKLHWELAPLAGQCKHHMLVDRGREITGNWLSLQVNLG